MARKPANDPSPVADFEASLDQLEQLVDKMEHGELSLEESLAAVESGIDLHGICLFPAVDMQDWHTGEWLHNGICDLVDEKGVLKRVPAENYVNELRRWQKELNRVTVLDTDPFSDPVELQDVIDAAKSGVNTVHIIDGRIEHSLLLEVLTEQAFGTMIRSH